MSNGQENIRLAIVLSPEEVRILTLWAKWHGKTKATYAGQILAARLEANMELVGKLVEEAARYRGMSREELEKEWLGEEDSE